MRRPSFQFYPADWLSNPNLRRCSFAERGIWLDVLCLLHDQEPYGLLRWPLKEIAQAVGCKPAELSALVRKGVLKGSDTALEEPFVYIPRSGRKDGDPVMLLPSQPGPIWYSSRMVKDEYVRSIRGEYGQPQGLVTDAPKGTPKGAPKHAPMGAIGAAFGPRVSSSSTSSSASTHPQPPRQRGRDEVPEGFDQFWKVYPKKAAKPAALKAWKKLAPTADLLATMLAALKRQTVSADWLKDHGQYIPHPATWLNQARWEDEVGLPVDASVESTGEAAVAQTASVLKALDQAAARAVPMPVDMFATGLVKGGAS